VADTVVDATKDGGLRKAIVAGIVSGVIVLIFIQPILGFLWHFVLSNIKSLNDSACHQAALDDPASLFGFWLEGMFFSIFFGGFFAFMVFAYLMHGKTIDHKLNLAQRAERVMTSRLLATLFFLVFLGAATFSIGGDYLVLQLTASFHQRLAVLAPKISDQEYKELLASWASMVNGEDYRNIVEKMDAKATASGITLPKLLPGAIPSP
jgi:hypothetical protein